MNFSRWSKAKLINLAKLFLKFPLNQRILMGIITVLAIILLVRTASYLSEQVVETNSATLYASDNIWSKKIATLPQKTRLHIVAKKYNWLKVKTNQNQVGWLPDWQMWQSKRNQIKSLTDATIVIDPGHGGSDSGALSANQKAEEKTYTLIFAKQLAAKLQKAGSRVYLTRNSDKYVSLSARPQLAEQVHATIFISIHFNSSATANTASGITTYYYHKKDGSLTLAQSIASKFNHQSLDNRGVEFGDFLVIRNNTLPAVLLELGYINNNYDLKQIKNASYQDQTTTAVVSGLKKYLAGN